MCLKFIWNLGCTVRAYDPTSATKRPDNSFKPNIHFYSYGLGPENGICKRTNLKVRSLDYLIQGKNA